jgi:FMN reductase
MVHMNVVLIAGSPCTPSRSSVLLEHVNWRLLNADAHCHTLALRDLPPAALLHAQADDPVLRSAIQRVQEADLVVIATPIYKAAYSGLLKVFLDLLPQDGLRGKSVLPLARGGSLAHLLAVDYALKPVLNALGARHIADTVFVSDSQLPRQPDGSYQAERTVIERVDRALAGLFEPMPQRRFTLTTPASAAVSPVTAAAAC